MQLSEQQIKSLYYKLQYSKIDKDKHNARMKEYRAKLRLTKKAKKSKLKKVAKATK